MYKCSQHFGAMLWVLFCSLNYLICYLHFTIKLISILPLNWDFICLHHRLLNRSRVHYMVQESEDSL